MAKTDDNVVVDDQALDLAHPATPVTVDQLAALGGAGEEKLARRIRLIEMTRLASIRTTEPEGWVLFKDPQGNVEGYPEDKECHRFRDFWGIEIYNVSDPPQKIIASAEDFHYRYVGDGFCKLTGQRVERIVGSRSSTEDFCRGKTGTELDVDVEKASRANMNGSIARELAGLGSVPLRTLDAAWKGTGKSSDSCSRGKGFGTGAERMGAPSEAQLNQPTVKPPICIHCKSNGLVRPPKGKRKAFYGCPNWAKHRSDGLDDWAVDVDEWVKKATAAEQPAPTPPPPAATTPTDAAPQVSAAPPPVARELRDDEVFGDKKGKR